MRLEIDNLVVHDVAAEDGERLASAIERELAALAKAGRADGLRSRDLPGGVFEIPAGLGVDDVARQVAQAIWACCRDAGGPSQAADSNHARAGAPHARSTE